MNEDDALSAMASLYKDGGIVNLEEHPRYPVKVSTGRPSIDYVTDGGIPRGRMVILAGEKSSGKSSLAIQLADKMAKKVLYVDVEYTLTTDYIRQLGADPSKFNHTMPQSTEVMCNVIRENIPNYDLIVVDSINNSASEEQLRKSAKERTMANRALVLSEQLPILVGLCNQYGTTLMILSQVRQNMNKANKHSPDTVVPGGESLHHNSSLTLEMFPSTKKKAKESEQMEAFDTVTGRLIRIKCTKNKVGKPFRTVKPEFTYGKGFTIEADVVAAALAAGILQKKGSWISYEETNIAQGQEKALKFMYDNPDVLEKITEQVTTYVIDNTNLD